MNNNVDVLNDPKGAFWKIATPLFFLSLFASVISFVNLFWISKLSQDAFFAFGVSQPLISLIYGFGQSIGVGTNSLMSREIGAKDVDGEYNTILHGILACLLLGAVFALLTLFLKDILSLMNVTESVDLAVDYLTPMLSFAFLIMLSSLFTNTLQAEGNSKTPSNVIMVTSILGVILVPIFIFIFDWGIKGVAYATILPSLLAVLYFLYLYLSGKTKVSMNFKYFKPGIVYQIFVVSVPNLIIGALWSIVGMFINSVLIEQLGQIGVLLYSSATQIQSLMSSPQSSFGNSLLTVGGQLSGAKENQKLKQMYEYVLEISISMSLICTVIFFFIRDYGFALFSVTGVETLVLYIAIFGIVIVASENVSKVSDKLLDGLGKSYHSLIMTIGTVLFEIGSIYLLSLILTSGLCVLVGIAIGELIFAAISVYLVWSILNGENKLEKDIDEIEKLES